MNEDKKIYIKEGEINRDPVIVADDQESIIKLKKEFLDLLARACRWCNEREIEENFIDCEQAFDGMFDGILNTLNEHAEHDAMLPISERQAKWLKERAVATRRPVATNPATLVATGKEEA